MQTYATKFTYATSSRSNNFLVKVVVADNYKQALNKFEQWAKANCKPGWHIIAEEDVKLV